VKAWLRQLFLFGIVGMIQVAIDSGVLIGLTRAGVDVAAANVCGRVAGALVGFLLNGKTTFPSLSGRRLHDGPLLRFILTWLALTAISTLLLVLLHEHVALEYVWLVKPMVEVCLAAVSFLVSKFWIYA
jgi:putative flippase GtrA